MLAKRKAEWEAANTPEAKAARQAEIDLRAAQTKARREAQAKVDAEALAERERRLAAAEREPIEAVEINSATESQLAGLQGLGLGLSVVQQILVERAKGRFKGWEDVVHRVVGLSAAETVARASAFGLTVNGRSLEGVEPDSLVARFARGKWLRRSG